MIKGLLIGHGKFPETLLDVARSILGEISDFQIVSYEKIPPADLENKVKKALKDLGEGEKIIFVDLYGSSGANVCKRIVVKDKNVATICGVNLPMLIKFLKYRERLKFDELVELVKKAGQDEIKKMGS
jgi:mannose/fructose/sorbose-specific phosphotransferase system IIA component